MTDVSAVKVTADSRPDVDHLVLRNWMHWEAIAKSNHKISIFPWLLDVGGRSRVTLIVR